VKRIRLFIAKIAVKKDVCHMAVEVDWIMSISITQNKLEKCG
jgi:hypothetical protein